MARNHTVRAMIEVEQAAQKLQEAVQNLRAVMDGDPKGQSFAISERVKQLLAVAYVDDVFFPRNKETAVQIHHGNGDLFKLSMLLEIK